MDEVERLVAQDASIKGMWCVPKYSNPTGTIYSDAVVERLAAMKTAAPDFRLYWDNAYGVHHLTSERIQIANILELCARHGNPNRPFLFLSTSKITLAGAGLAMFAASSDNVKWLLARLTHADDRSGQAQPVASCSLPEERGGILQLMDRHRALIAPKFQKVLDIFGEKLAHVPGRQLDQSQGRLLHQPRRSERLRAAGGCSRQRSWRRPYACRLNASLRERS